VCARDLVQSLGDDSDGMSAVASDAGRLARRLERERRARREAEQISERATRGLYERHAELVLLERVAVASNEATSVGSAIKVAIDGVCAHTRWPVGHGYLRSEGEPDELVPSGIWHLADERRFASLRRVTEGMSFASGVGLPGRVLERGQPAWIPDVSADSNFPRAQQARDLGVKAAFAFPVLVGSDVQAVLEFFTPEAVEPDEPLLVRLAHIGSQVGRVIERSQSARERERLTRRMEVLLNSAGDGICGIDLDGKTTFANPAAARLLGWPVDELIGRPLHDLVHAAPAGHETHSRSSCPLHVPGVIAHRPDDDTFQRPDGTSFPVEYTTRPLQEDGLLSGAVITFKDVTERRRFELQLQHLADHDVLTDLINRRRFEAELERAVLLSRRYGTGGAALMLDLDSFKLVNDALGHHAGDELIRSVAQLLKGRLRETDVLARLGGDEFAVLLARADRAEAERVAADLLDAIRRHSAGIGGKPMRVSGSIGIAVLGDEEPSGEEVLVRADVAMYAAKGAGRDRFATYTEELGRKARTGGGLSSSERIRRALAEDRFVLYYQPILDLAANEISQLEVLLRMEDEAGEIVLPGSFLPTAERFGLIQDIDRWVVQAAVGLLAEGGPAEGLDLLVEVNLSGRSVGDPELPALIEGLLSTTGVDAANLIFEVTETAAIANMEEARAFAERLSSVGCRFALDDFGAGFGSFYYLKYLPLAYLKIDGDFVRNLPESPIDQRVVRAMVDVARGLGMKTIAEFVQDAETLELLRRFGVDYGQGYHIARPKPVEALRGAARGSIASLQACEQPLSTAKKSDQAEA
jgi:diguanylate cyclase (GGDEF)-like protein/PAS domain S-box-containing protein